MTKLESSAFLPPPPPPPPSRFVSGCAVGCASVVVIGLGVAGVLVWRIAQIPSEMREVETASIHAAATHFIDEEPQSKKVWERLGVTPKDVDEAARIEVSAAISLAFTTWFVARPWDLGPQIRTTCAAASACTVEEKLVSAEWKEVAADERTTALAEKVPWAKLEHVDAMSLIHGTVGLSQQEPNGPKKPEASVDSLVRVALDPTSVIRSARAHLLSNDDDRVKHVRHFVRLLSHTALPEAFNVIRFLSPDIELADSDVAAIEEETIKRAELFHPLVLRDHVFTFFSDDVPKHARCRALRRGAYLPAIFRPFLRQDETISYAALDEVMDKHPFCDDGALLKTWNFFREMKTVNELCALPANYWRKLFPDEDACRKSSGSFSDTTLGRLSSAVFLPAIADRNDERPLPYDVGAVSHVASSTSPPPDL